MSISGRILLTLCCLGLGGCGPSLDRISAAANSARDSSERLADSADAANKAHEQKILADAQAMKAKLMEEGYNSIIKK